MRTAFLRAVRPARYERADLATPRPGTEPGGPPQVVWAGRTPAGPAAVVAQLERTPVGPTVVVGYLGPGRNGPEVVTVTRPAPGYEDYVGAFVGPARTALLVLDRGDRLTWAVRYEYAAGGGIRLVDQPVRFRDGVAVLAVPAGSTPDQVQVARAGTPSLGRIRSLGNADFSVQSSVHVLPWGDKQGPLLAPVSGAAGAWPGESLGLYDRLWQVFRKAVDGLPSDLSVCGSLADNLWFAYGATPDGSRLVAGDCAYGNDPSRAYAVLQSPDGQTRVAAGGPVNPSAALPVAVPLPRGQGWVVAQQGATLRWATDAGPWTDAGTNAALLPATATRVRVTLPGQTPAVVRLPG